MTRHRLWELGNSKLGALLIGFTLTTFIGGAFAYTTQRMHWRRSAEFEVCRQALSTEHAQEMELFRVRLEWGEKHAAELTSALDARIGVAARARERPRRDPRWAEYEDAIKEWDTVLQWRRAKLADAFGDALAADFAPSGDPGEGDGSDRSVQAHLADMDAAIVALRVCRLDVDSECDVFRIAAQSTIRKAANAARRFENGLHEELRSRALAAIDSDGPSAWTRCTERDRLAGES